MSGLKNSCYPLSTSVEMLGPWSSPVVSLCIRLLCPVANPFRGYGRFSAPMGSHVCTVLTSQNMGRYLFSVVPGAVRSCWLFQLECPHEAFKFWNSGSKTLKGNLKYHRQILCSVVLRWCESYMKKSTHHQIDKNPTDTRVLHRRIGISNQGYGD